MRRLEDDMSPFSKKLVESNQQSKIPRAREGTWEETFLSAIMQGSSVTEATRIARIEITTPYHKRYRDEAFKRAWDEAATIGTDFLEHEAQRRAYHGTLKPVFYKGVECGFVREYSDILLWKLLTVRKPEVYRVADDEESRGNVTININMDVVRSREELQGNTAPVIDVEVVDDGTKQESTDITEAAQIPYQQGTA